MRRRIAHAIVLVTACACGCGTSATVGGRTVLDTPTDDGAMEAGLPDDGAAADLQDATLNSSMTDDARLDARAEVEAGAVDANVNTGSNTGPTGGQSDASADVNPAALDAAGGGWIGACASCYSAAGCDAGATIGFACPAECTTAPPIRAGGCTDAILSPWNGEPDSSATLLYCCPWDPGAPPPSQGPADAALLVTGMSEAGAHEGGAPDAGAADAGVTCIPSTTCPNGANCGTVPDGCGGTLKCGADCSTAETCGGGGAANQCGCQRKTCDSYGATCGLLSNGCGGTLDCGDCPNSWDSCEGAPNYFCTSPCAIVGTCNNIAAGTEIECGYSVSGEQWTPGVTCQNCTPLAAMDGGSPCINLGPQPGCVGGAGPCAYLWCCP